jgi:hypothetical protein
MAKLKPIILKKLMLKTELDESSVREAISRIRSEYGFLTLNASAQIFAKKRNLTVMRHLDQEDRVVLSHLETKKITVPIRQTRKNASIIKMAVYQTDDRWLQKHIDEINTAYTFGCYTATFILCRKVLENLLLQILQKKYDGKTLNDRQKYFDFSNDRNLDFSKLTANLRDSSNDFITKNKLVERICQLSDGFRDDANDMTHSLYHIASKREIDGKNFQDILYLIKQLNDML